MTAHADQTRADKRAACGVIAILLLIVVVAWTPLAQSGNVRSAAGIDFRINPNVATREELMLLPGIGPKLAEVIIAHRDASAHAPAFASVEDLLPIPRIGPKTIELLRPFVRFDAARTSPLAAVTAKTDGPTHDRAE